jgi:hypothetical protein
MGGGGFHPPYGKTTKCVLLEQNLFLNLAFDLVNKSGYNKAKNHVKKSSYRVCPHPGGCKKCSHMVLRVIIDLYQLNCSNSLFYSHTVQSVPISWRMYKVHLVMQPHGLEGTFRSRSIKTGNKTAHEVCKWFIMMFYLQTVQCVPSSWRMYKVHFVMQPHGFEGSFRSR